jgi:hypothetical protein
MTISPIYGCGMRDTKLVWHVFDGMVASYLLVAMDSKSAFK